MIHFVKDKRKDEIVYAVQAANEDYACVLAADYASGRYLAPESFEVVDNISNIKLKLEDSPSNVHEVGDTESEMVEL